MGGGGGCFATCGTEGDGVMADGVMNNDVRKLIQKTTGLAGSNINYCKLVSG